MTAAMRGPRGEGVATATVRGLQQWRGGTTMVVRVAASVERRAASVEQGEEDGLFSHILRFV